jgi:hypothetical protein
VLIAIAEDILGLFRTRPKPISTPEAQP